jgi:hypothetical protein
VCSLCASLVLERKAFGATEHNCSSTRRVHAEWHWLGRLLKMTYSESGTLVSLRPPSSDEQGQRSAGTEVNFLDFEIYQIVFDETIRG